MPSQALGLQYLALENPSLRAQLETYQTVVSNGKGSLPCTLGQPHPRALLVAKQCLNSSGQKRRDQQACLYRAGPCLCLLGALWEELC